MSAARTDIDMELEDTVYAPLLPRRECDPATTLASVERAGVCWMVFPEAISLAHDNPYALVERLVGQRPVLVQADVIQDVGGHSFAHSRILAPFHTDVPYGHDWVPAHLQVMICVTQAERGGESAFIDGWRLVGDLETSDPELFEQVFSVSRRKGFNSRPEYGPTLAMRGDDLVLVHPPRPREDDRVGVRFQAAVDVAPRIELRAAPGDVLVANNLRMLHGRRPFEGGARRFIRINAWLPRAFPAPPAFVARARAVAATISERLAGEPAFVRRRFGCDAKRRSPEELARLSELFESLHADCLVDVDRVLATTPRRRRAFELVDRLVAHGIEAITDDEPADAEGVFDAALACANGETARRDVSAVLDFRAPYLEEKLVKDKIAASRDEAAALFAELMKWLVLCEEDGRSYPMISRRVDEAWHEFVLFTNEYARFSNTYFGRYVHHLPSNAPKRAPSDRLFAPATDDDFRRAYAARFGTLPPAWDDAAAIGLRSRIVREASRRTLSVRFVGEMAELAYDDGRRSLVLARVDAWGAPALTFLASCDSFYVRELPAPLDAEEKVLLCKALVAQETVFRLAP